MYISIIWNIDTTRRGLEMYKIGFRLRAVAIKKVWQVAICYGKWSFKRLPTSGKLKHLRPSNRIFRFWSVSKKINC